MVLRRFTGWPTGAVATVVSEGLLDSGKSGISGRSCSDSARSSGSRFRARVVGWVDVRISVEAVIVSNRWLCPFLRVLTGTEAGLNVLIGSDSGGGIDSWLFWTKEAVLPCEPVSWLDTPEFEILELLTLINMNGGVLPSGLRCKGDNTLPAFIMSGDRMKWGLGVCRGSPVLD